MPEGKPHNIRSIFRQSPPLFLNRHIKTQSRQSAKLFLQSSELGLPNPSPSGECAPPPFGPGGGGWIHSQGERGWGSPNSDEGTNTVVLFINTYFVHQNNAGRPGIGGFGLGNLEQRRRHDIQRGDSYILHL